MMRSQTAFERAMRLAVVTGLKCALGPAMLAAAYNRPNRKALALAALGEMALDKLPVLPSRSSLPLLIPRAAVGYWVAKSSMEEEGVQDPLVAPMGAAVAAGVATIAPAVRSTLKHVLGVPDFLLGIAEDYVALRLGGDAVGLSMENLKSIGMETVQDLQDNVAPALDQARERFLPMAVGR